MISMVIEFFEGNEKEPTVTLPCSLPAVPRFGDKIHFRCTERDTEIFGQVRECIYNDLDGETSLTIVCDLMAYTHVS